MKTLLKILAVLVFVLLLIVLFLGGYLGLIPGLSKIMGTDKPRDLGVRYTEADRATARGKSQVIYEALPENTPAEESIQRFGVQEVNTEFTAPEITALMNNRPWRYWPYADVQVKFNSDGSGEISGTLLKDKIAGYGAAIGIPQEAMALAQKLLPTNPTFYVKMKASLVNNQVLEFEPQKFEIGRVPMPLGVFLSYFQPVLPTLQAFAAESDDAFSELSRIKNKRGLIIRYINQRLAIMRGFYAKEARFGENKLIFNGTLPEKEATVR